MLIVKIKKNLKKITFLDDFFSWWVHCAPHQSEFLIFFSKFQNTYFSGVSKKLEDPQGMLVLPSKSENGVFGFTHVHCAQTKNILAKEPSH